MLDRLVTQRLLLAVANPSAHAPLLATDFATTFPCLLNSHVRTPIADKLVFELPRDKPLSRNVGIS